MKNLVALLLVLTGCATVAPAPAPIVSHHQLTEEDAIASAPSESLVLEAVRRYMIAIDHKKLAPPNDLRAEIDTQLAANPYTHVQAAREHIVDRFFGASLLKQVPDNDGAAHEYVGVLRDQALRARAESDQRLSAAITARADRVQRLLDLLEDTVGTPTAGL
jgi:hypothetical protein